MNSFEQWHSQRQKAFFKTISRDFDAVNIQICNCIFNVSRKFYYPRLKGATVLDIGNGGQSPSILLGDQITSEIKLFVGLDNSVDMLNRSADPYTRVVGDGMALPFQDGAFDYVIVCAVLHHLGFVPGNDPLARIKQFLKEARRVCRNEILLYEPILPSWIECLVSCVPRILGPMHTFMWSEQSIDRALHDLNVEKQETRIFSLSEITHPFYWMHILIGYPWLKFPAIIHPVYNMFFIIPGCGHKSAGSEQKSLSNEAPRGLPRSNLLRRSSSGYAGRVIAKPCEAKDAILSRHSSPGATQDAPCGKPQGFLAKKGGELFACPRCHQLLISQPGLKVCSLCKISFPIESNVPVLVWEKALPLH